MNPPIPNTFDPHNAAALCQASQCAYLEPAPNLIRIHDKDTDTLVLLDQAADDLIVAFRGTQDLRNWLTDLDCRLVQLHSFRVHRGFHAALQSVWPDLTSQISNLHSSRLWFTGHSLGGALAMLAALYALQDAIDCAGVYTFGQPRVGDARLRDCYNLGGLLTKTFRVVRANDIVPRVPWLLARYRHAGHEIFFPSSSSGGASAASPILDPPWWQKLPCDALGLWRAWTNKQDVLLADHHIDTYANLLGGAHPFAILPATGALVNRQS